jgi:hypothetical protein
MKAGILTLHNQLNYGGVLQAFALQKAIKNFGVNVKIIDYWISPGNSHLLGYWFGAKDWLVVKVLRFVYLSFRDGFVFDSIVRRYRTIKFIRTLLELSDTTYKTARDLEQIKDYDCLVVGSDQVWNYKWHGCPNPFLLEKIDNKIKRVSYAASFGFTELPSEFIADYQKGLLKFSAISVREKDGVELVHKWTGLRSQWVTDPTLLLGKQEWEKVLNLRQVESRKYIFCYWLGDVSKLRLAINGLLKTHKKIYICGDLKFVSCSINDFCKILKFRLYCFFNPQIKVCFSFGPKEFVKGVAQSEGIVSDSYHALMFASIFEKPVKIFINSSDWRMPMRSRLEEFCKHYCMDNVLESEVIDNFELVTPNYPLIKSILKMDISKSYDFLMKALV